MHSSSSEEVYVGFFCVCEIVILVAAALLDTVIRALTEGNSSNKRQ